MSPILGRVYSAPGGTDALDVLMKYMYVVAVTAVWLTRPLHLCTCLSPIGHHPPPPDDRTTCHSAR
jgi:hypothetical protein